MGIAKSDAVTPLGPGEPVEASALSQMGGTFAERKAAADAAAKKAAKAVEPDDSESKAVESTDAENKSVSSKKATTK